MPRTCSICTNEAKYEIDRELVAGRPLRSVAERFSVSVAALHRHRQQGHIASAIARAHEASDVSNADTLLAHVEDLRERALIVLAAAERAGDLRAATAAIREARGCLDLLGRVTGELVQKHAHLHAHAKLVTPPLDLSVLDEDEIQFMRRIARKLAIGISRRRDEQQATLQPGEGSARSWTGP